MAALELEWTVRAQRGEPTSAVDLLGNSLENLDKSTRGELLAKISHQGIELRSSAAAPPQSSALQLLQPEKQTGKY